jgi:hypothetical protein
MLAIEFVLFAISRRQRQVSDRHFLAIGERRLAPRRESLKI